MNKRNFKEAAKSYVVGLLIFIFGTIFLTQILNLILIPYDYQLAKDSQELYDQNLTVMMNNIKTYFNQFDNIYNHNFTQFLGKNAKFFWFDIIEGGGNINNCVRFNALDISPSIMLLTKCGSCELYSRLFVGIMNNLGYEAFEIIFPGEDHHSAGFFYENRIVHVDPMYDIDLPLNERENEVNVTYAYGKFLNGTIFDLTEEYSEVSNLTVFVKNEQGDLLNNIPITIISCALIRDGNQTCEPIYELNCNTNNEGFCNYVLGDAQYNITIHYEHKTKTITHFLSPNINDTLIINV